MLPRVNFIEVDIMTIKQSVYLLHQELKNQTTPQIKQTHVYELIAAAFGFNSYASLKSDAILIQSKDLVLLNVDKIDSRLSELGYISFPAIKLIEILRSEEIGIILYKDLIARLNDGDYLSDDEIEKLTSAKNNPWAYYCLALHYLENEDDVEQIGSEYWYQQMQSGRILNDVEREWALAYTAELNKPNKYESYLRKAASLGCDLALLDLAEMFDDASVFESEHQFTHANPMRIAEVAESLGRHKEQYHWLTVSAESGNTVAMRDLIDTFDSKDLTRCWSWVYLSRLVGDDLTEHHHIGVHEDGSEYDDDVGGPIYVGGTEGVDLDPLSKEQDVVAKRIADSLFERIMKSR